MYFERGQSDQSCLLASNFSPAVNGFGNQRPQPVHGAELLTSRSRFGKGRNSGVGAQFFNILNHPHFDQSDADIASPRSAALLSSPTSLFGSFLGAGASPRLIQLHANITFKWTPN
jgi:hypothetical protein